MPLCNQVLERLTRALIMVCRDRWHVVTDRSVVDLHGWDALSAQIGQQSFVRASGQNDPVHPFFHKQFTAVGRGRIDPVPPLLGLELHRSGNLCVKRIHNRILPRVYHKSKVMIALMHHRSGDRIGRIAQRLGRLQNPFPGLWTH